MTQDGKPNQTLHQKIFLLPFINLTKLNSHLLSCVWNANKSCTQFTRFEQVRKLSTQTLADGSADDNEHFSLTSSALPSKYQQIRKAGANKPFRANGTTTGQPSPRNSQTTVT